MTLNQALDCSLNRADHGDGSVQYLTVFTRECYTTIDQLVGSPMDVMSLDSCQGTRQPRPQALELGMGAIKSDLSLKIFTNEKLVYHDPIGQS